MNLLLDTHTFLWFCQGDRLLSELAKSLIERDDNNKFVSIASCWEIAIKAGLGKLKLGEPFVWPALTFFHGRACSQKFRFFSAFSLLYVGVFVGGSSTREVDKQ